MAMLTHVESNPIYIGTQSQGLCQPSGTHLQNLGPVHIAAALALAAAAAVAAAPGVAVACGDLREVLGVPGPSVQVPSVQRPPGSRPWTP